MRILYWGPHRMTIDEENRANVNYASFDQLLKESDFISVHAAMRPETHHLIGARELGLMKRSAILVNTSRGPVIDEAALVRALSERRISGAGLDVFEHEPVVSQELLKLPNVVMTPHLGSAVVEVRETMANTVVDNILALLEGRKPPNCINPQVFAD